MPSVTAFRFTESQCVHLNLLKKFKGTNVPLEEDEVSDSDEDEVDGQEADGVPTADEEQNIVAEEEPEVMEPEGVENQEPNETREAERDDDGAWPWFTQTAEEGGSRLEYY